MYLPSNYKVTDTKKINQFIRENNFADLVTVRDGTLYSNKVPFYFDEAKQKLYGHCGIHNSQLEDIQRNDQVLIIFSGVDAYISPRWPVSNNMVPTWNFQTLQVRGKARLLDEVGLISVLDKLSKFHELKYSNPWQLSELDEGFKSKIVKVIMGFEVDINDIQFKEKMSQNRSRADQLSIIDALVQAGDVRSTEVADIMRKNTLTTND